MIPTTNFDKYNRISHNYHESDRSCNGNIEPFWIGQETKRRHHTAVFILGRSRGTNGGKQNNFTFLTLKLFHRSNLKEISQNNLGVVVQQLLVVRSDLPQTRFVCNTNYNSLI